jgi:hypothetical protein
MSETRLIRVLEALLPRFFPREPFLGPRKYRVVRMRPSASSGVLSRVELQIVQKTVGMPDMLLVPIWAGLAGSRTEMTPGGFALVQFIDGDRQQPYVCAFATADDPAWRPVDMVLDATTIQLGAGMSPAAVRVGDDVDCGALQVTMGAGSVATVAWIPPGGGAPQTIAVAPLFTPITGVAAEGSAKVSIE